MLAKLSRSGTHRQARGSAFPPIHHPAGANSSTAVHRQPAKASKLGPAASGVSKKQN
jgi:hypothetical protein